MTDITHFILESIFSTEIQDLQIFFEKEIDNILVFGIYWERKDTSPSLEHTEYITETLRKRILLSKNHILKKIIKETKGITVDTNIRRIR